MPAVKAVLFDLDDTLFDHAHSSRHALAVLRDRFPCLAARPLQEVIDLYGVALEAVHVRFMAGELSVSQARVLRFQQLFEQLGQTCSEDEAADIGAAYREAYTGTWRATPGARTLLASLAPDVSIGIVTNNLASEQVAKLEACGLSGFVDALVVSHDVGVSKPDPGIFAIGLARLGCAADEAVMVGDSWANDVCGAREAGIRAVWYNRADRAAPEPDVARVIRSFEPVERARRLLVG